MGWQKTLSHRPTPSYSVSYCHPTAHPTQPHRTTAYRVLHESLAPAYPVLHQPTPSPVLHSMCATGAVSCHPTISYPGVPILSQRTTSALVLNWILLPCYPVLPHPSQSYPSYPILPCTVTMPWWARPLICNSHLHQRVSRVLGDIRW